MTVRGKPSFRPQAKVMRGRRGTVLWFPLLCVLVAGCNGAPGDGASKGAAESRPGSVDGDNRPEGGSDGAGHRAQVGLAAIDMAVRPVVDGLEAPLGVTHAGDGSGRLFVVEQGGTVRIVKDGRLEPEPWLDLSDKTAPGGEQGLLGLAFHPDYARNGRLFVDYTDLQGDTVVSEYRRAGGAGPPSERVLLTIDQPFANHNGGGLAFGPDGYLYIAAGDGGGAGDPGDNGQALDTPLGKLLRIDPDAGEDGSPYGVPPDNPFAGHAGARPEIWAYGLRNPWRFSFDRDKIWIADVGQEDLEEIDRAPARRGGINYGWDDMEGSACYEPTAGCRREGRKLPLAEYSHDEGCSVTGGYVYRGRLYPALGGAYIFGDYCSGTLWAVAADGPPEQTPVELLDTDHLVSSFGVGEDGELYLTDISSGSLLQITAK